MAGLVKEYGWKMPERDKGDWKEHQRNVTQLLETQALASGNEVGEQVELEITYEGKTVTTKADNLVLDTSDLLKGGVLVDAKFSGTYDLGNDTIPTLESKLTKNQKIVWSWIRQVKRNGNFADLSIVPKGQAAERMGLDVGQSLPSQFVANLSLKLYVSNGVGSINGIVPKTYC